MSRGEVMDEENAKYTVRNIRIKNNMIVAILVEWNIFFPCSTGP